MDESNDLPARVRAAVVIRYHVPGTFPPRYNAIAAGTVFASADLPEADVRHMLRQKTLVAHDGALAVADEE
ncbi:hypothetical protein [Acidocella sp.]|uniref:hypothetical protein n=1 Tax=Acidocella sp. TaxID=50710 RepID=UPI00262DFE2D|nr:hypothetical protein [Acidocella sp.]MDD2794366.1 hypothetical protein [Acidocella sp.]